jgi:1,4-dihydroxy-2-naphthoyl-CoA hydrolase
MTFLYQHTVRFRETDAAGVVYFANTLAACHEAYEASLTESGIEVRLFFSASAIAFPIIHAEADYLQPAFCGDCQEIHLTPMLQSENVFEIQYLIYNAERPERIVSKALTRHLCINPATRQRQSLPQEILAWHTKWG